MRKSQHIELEPKKWPRQTRSKATFAALTEACALILPQYGYAGTTTNRIAETAGVGISSLYEYFPGKDAIIARVAEERGARILMKLALQAQSIWGTPASQLMERWLFAVYQVLVDEKPLLRVFTYEIPYSVELLKRFKTFEKVMMFSSCLESGAMAVLPHRQSPVSMYLITTTISHTLVQLVLAPPPQIEAREVIQELAQRMDLWVRSADVVLKEAMQEGMKEGMKEEMPKPAPEPA